MSAKLMAAELIEVAGVEAVAAAVESESVSDLFGQYESLLRARLGGDWTPSEMGRAREIARTIALGQIRIDAKQYEDYDDCLAAAADDYAESHGLEGWDLSPRWADENREQIILSVPVPKAD